MKRTFAIALAALAVTAAGCGDDESKDGGGGAASEPAPAQTQTEKSGSGNGQTKLAIAADPGGALKFDKSSLTAKPGTVTIEMDNPSSIPHAVGIEGNGVDEEGRTVEKGGKSVVSANLEPGEYEFYCPVPGHEPAGMKGTLTVE